MKRRTLTILENARQKKRDDSDELQKIQRDTNNNENTSPNSSFVENTPDREIPKISSRVNNHNSEMGRRTVLTPKNVIAEESDTTVADSFESLPPQVLVRSSSVSSSSSSCSSSSSSNSSSSSSSSSKSNASLKITATSANSNNYDTISEIVSTQIKAPAPCASSCYRLAKETVISYRISPVNQFESDPDLSDDDPTYTENVETSPPFSEMVDSASTRIIDIECQPSGSGYNETMGANEGPRKRPRNPEKWKQNIIKTLRNSGQPYTSQSKSKKEVPARSMKPPCTCHMKCVDDISETNRKGIFDSFWKLGNLELQRIFIKSCMVEIHPKYKYSNAEKPRAPNNAFYFTIEGKQIRVCKTYFINTLDITDRQIRTVKEKVNKTGFLNAEQRGKHDNRKKTCEIDVQDIVDHINSIPRIPAHYIRAQSKRDYISGGKTVKDLWRDFSRDRHEQNKHEIQYWLYYDIFTTRFNISFFQPKKDKCDTCLDYELSNEKGKEELQEDHDMHITEKTICRLEKKDDRSNINEENICTVYDLQAVMQCPIGETSSFYYVSKLNCLNFTMAELTKKTKQMTNNSDAEDLGAYGNVYCYFWDETQARRGANEIGSCVLDYLKKVNERSANKSIDVTFYSDNCAGQNKNKYIACMYAYAVSQFPNIKSITHKFFITGHTQSEGDNVHSLIEKEIKKNQKSGPIYTPHEYIALIKSAKKNGSPFRIQEISYDRILNLKTLQEQWGYNFNEDDCRDQVLWNDIKVLRCVKTEPFMLYYKNSYTQDRFMSINMRNKRKKMPSIEHITINKLYQAKLPLAENKKKGLNELLRKNLIPHYYVYYFKNILSE